ncbi:hypothetical protein A2U01_0011041, partial [Trifolium medium]|nr:hypothetical protein [Trifolium medium]
ICTQIYGIAQIRSEMGTFDGDGLAWLAGGVGVGGSLQVAAAYERKKEELSIRLGLQNETDWHQSEMLWVNKSYWA